MIQDEDITSAVAAGILTAEAATALRAHAAQRAQSPQVDEEQFRLVTGFNDIFVVIACALLLTSVYWLGISVAPVAGVVAVGAVSWVLAEFFVRQRHMALPAIVLLACFVGSGFWVGSLLGAQFSAAPANAVLAGCVLAAAMAWLHWQRFHVPLTVAAGTGAALVGGVFVVLRLVPLQLHGWEMAPVFAAGLVAFGLAMAWDMADRNRITHRSDVAFWLHLLAAPLLVHPVFMAIGVMRGGIGVSQALLVVVLYCAIALLSLAIDRRALMVSALGYVLYAFTTLLTSSGVVGQGFATTALFIGVALLLLSAFWQRSRAFALQFLPAGWLVKLPPLQVPVRA